MDEVINGNVNENMEQPALEDVVSKERVTELIKREKEAAYRKAARDYQAEIEQLKTGQTQQMGGMAAPAMDIDAVYNEVTNRLQREIEKAQQDSQKQEYETYVKGQVDSYIKKMDSGSELAEDFKEMTSKFRPEKFKEVFFLANGFENTPALIYELSKNPHKLATLDYLAKHDPELAKDQMEAIARSIDANATAKASNVSAQAPISRPKPSLAAGADSGAMGIADYKKAPWLKG